MYLYDMIALDIDVPPTCKPSLNNTVLVPKATPDKTLQPFFPPAPLGGRYRPPSLERYQFVGCVPRPRIRYSEPVLTFDTLNDVIFVLAMCQSCWGVIINIVGKITS